MRAVHSCYSLYHRIDIRYLLAQSTEHEITHLIVSQIEMRPISIIFLSNIVLCGLNCFNNNNIFIISIISIIIII